MPQTPIADGKKRKISSAALQSIVETLENTNKTIGDENAKLRLEIVEFKNNAAKELPEQLQQKIVDAWVDVDFFERSLKNAKIKLAELVNQTGLGSVNIRVVAGKKEG